ncbi:hypothetical protein TEQG_04696 [Trichophyton equinum CBS 127.97]|uniref:C2H2-type domain-containing protein n=1 Tax=Trichophyton equinum (strain ATCC MYA-4606 / CBS 127.97) TaxID=559882 RepID=F2PUX0_TRIEC|nr:hypothetical protein TEQG_04696 [Trichophyton equinum CBS 127.97]
MTASQENSVLRSLRSPAKGSTRFQCTTCLETFRRADHLLRHGIMHRGKGKSFPCFECCRAFNERAELASHGELISNMLQGEKIVMANTTQHRGLATLHDRPSGAGSLGLFAHDNGIESSSCTYRCWLRSRHIEVVSNGESKQQDDDWLQERKDERSYPWMT